MLRIVFVLLTGLLIACNADQKKLPIYGHHDIDGQDTTYHKIPEFSFLNQDSLLVRNQDLSDNIYVSDFFFISCPSICPKVKKQMLRIYDKFESDKILKLVSHTMDPKRDTPEALNLYARNLEVNTEKWMFLTGDKYDLHDMADDYFITVIEDENVPGGYDHSGKLILVDKDGHVRSFCEGTDPDDVSRFLDDIQWLIDSYEN